MSEATFVFGDDNFDETIGQGVSLVDLYADWCGPCKIMAPTIDKLAEAFQGKATVGKLNVDDNQSTASKLSVTSIPTVILYKDGEEKNRFVGVQQEANLQKAIEELI